MLYDSMICDTYAGKTQLGSVTGYLRRLYCAIVDVMMISVARAAGSFE